MTAVHALRHPYAIVTASIVRALIDKQCEMLRAIQLRPELSACIGLSSNEIEQTIAAHMIALRSLKETP